MRMAGFQGVAEHRRELHTLQADLAAFQREELEALGSCLSMLLARAPRQEALIAWQAHEAARARTRDCLRRLHSW